MSSHDYEFTSTEEMNNFEDGDTAMELTGYVDSIEGLRDVKTHQRKVFKFVLNNGNNRRMRVLLWGGDAMKYKDRVTMNQIISLTMGTIREMKTQYPLPSGDSYVLTEFHVQTASTVQFHGVYNDNTSLSDYKEVSLSSITSVTGRVCTEVYIRTPFKPVMSGSGVQAMGLTVDEKFKLPVGIVNFTPKEELQPGVCVKIYGVMSKNKMGGSFFMIDEMRFIEIVPDKKMSMSDMKKIAVAATSKRLSEGSIPPSKRNKENEDNDNKEREHVNENYKEKMD